MSLQPFSTQDFNLQISKHNNKNKNNKNTSSKSIWNYITNHFKSTSTSSSSEITRDQKEMNQNLYQWKVKVTANPKNKKDDLDSLFEGIAYIAYNEENKNVRECIGFVSITEAYTVFDLLGNRIQNYQDRKYVYRPALASVYLSSSSSS